MPAARPRRSEPGAPRSVLRRARRGRRTCASATRTGPGSARTGARPSPRCGPRARSGEPTARRSGPRTRRRTPAAPTTRRAPRRRARPHAGAGGRGPRARAAPAPRGRTRRGARGRPRRSPGSTSPDSSSASVAPSESAKPEKRDEAPRPFSDVAETAVRTISWRCASVTTGRADPPSRAIQAKRSSKVPMSPVRSAPCFARSSRSMRSTSDPCGTMSHGSRSSAPR